MPAGHAVNRREGLAPRGGMGRIGGITPSGPSGLNGLNGLKGRAAHRAGLAVLALWVLLILPWVLGGCAAAGPTPPAECAGAEPAGPVLHKAGLVGAQGAPEVGSGYAPKALARSAHFMVVAAHPLAAQAGCQMLAQGGSAVDAAVAVQMVLNVVEPQSSGLGGGAFMLHYRAADGALSAWDGRETAPAAALENDLRWIGPDDRRPPGPSVRTSGRAIGVPGVLHMLETAHRRHGRLPWKALFAPAIRIAEDGFAISPRLAASIAAAAADLQRDPQARAHFLQEDGRPKTAGTRLRSPALAATLRTLAEQGSAPFYDGAIAQDIVDAVADPRGGATPGKLTRADLRAYRSVQRTPLCRAYRGTHVVCGMPPPSSGGLAVAQVLGLLQHFDLAALAPTAPDGDGGRPTVQGVHLVTEAERLAYADRDRYVADPDFVPLPGGSPARMLDGVYLQQRAALIRRERSMGTTQPGRFGTPPPGQGGPTAEHGTTQVTLVDRWGDVVSLTSTIESFFGSMHMTRAGFLLNNQLTDFAAQPVDAAGEPVANRLQAGKRPRSSMAPTLVFERRADGARGRFVLATGSPGGARIIQYVSKTLVGVLDWGLDAQQATALINFGAANSAQTQVGGEHPLVHPDRDGADDPLIRGLRALGHTVNSAAQVSGVATIVRRADVDGVPHYEGGADPRREGMALGPPVRLSPRP